jgi:phosphatidate cytidylyltransferase
MRSALQKRIVLGLVMIALLCGLFWLDWRLEQITQDRAVRAAREGRPMPWPAWPPVGLPMAVVVLLLIAVALVELVRLCAHAGVLLLIFSGLCGAGILGTMPFWWQFLSPFPPLGDSVLLVLGVTVLIVFADQMIRSRTADAVRTVACTFLAILYLGVGMAMMLSIRLVLGVPALVLFLAAVKFTDIGAYFVGSLIGRHKMIAWLSPGKSWEGLVGGLLAAAGVSMLIAVVLPTPLTWPKAAAFGVVVGLFGQFADLCESLLKRSAKLKDSGASLPGFGGVLDVLDSPLLAAPVAYMMLGILR